MKERKGGREGGRERKKLATDPHWKEEGRQNQ
jgi:hypothetical protein